MSLRERLFVSVDEEIISTEESRMVPELGAKYELRPGIVQRLRGKMLDIVLENRIDQEFLDVFPTVESIGMLTDFYNDTNLDEQCTLVAFSEDTGLFAFAKITMVIALSAVRKVTT